MINLSVGGKIFLFVLILGITSFHNRIYAQKNVTVIGYIKDVKTGEELPYTTVYIEELKTGIVSNQYGFYSITLKPGTYHLTFNYVGYNAFTQTISTDKKMVLNIEMVQKSKDLEEVSVYGQKKNLNILRNEMGTTKLDAQEIKSIPVLFGERDVLKTIQLLPGVAAGTEGTGGFFVRGGGNDQNLILIDDAPVYNASHLVGFFSVFNSDALKDVTLIKSGIPAQYGGRLSSVLNIQMNNGNMKEYSVSGGIGLISSRLTIEGPIIKDKSSFIISGRRTYGGLAFKFAKEERLKESDVYFYDLNLKANYKISDKDRLFLSGYFGRDALKYSKEFGYDWGNATTTLRWNHLFSDKIFSNLSVIYSQYNYDINIFLEDDMLNLQSGINNFSLKDDFNWFINTNNTIRAGFNMIYYKFKPGEIYYQKANNTDMVIDKKYGLESSAYISNEQKINDWINLEYGLRYSGYHALGTGTEYTFNKERNVIDTVYYGEGELIKFYKNLEPRFLVNFIIDPSNSIKASYSRTSQYLHLLSNVNVSIPNDLWVPSSTIIKPEKADQFSIGYFKNFKKNMFETSVEIYYKKLFNQVDYINGANTLFNRFVEGDLTFGYGRSYGLELYIQKKLGKLTGWFSGTLSRTERKFEEINSGNFFPMRYDRTFDIDVILMYQISPRVSANATWVYYTGDAVTFPGGKYLVDNMPIAYYSARNAQRMPDYHRLDLGVSVEGKKHKKFHSSWNFAIYNVYARENPFLISFRPVVDHPGKLEAVQISLFSIVPSISWDFKF
jgi:hypothetical protein